MVVENPGILWLLLLIVPLTLVWLAVHARGRRALVAMGGEWRRQRLVAVYVFKWFFSHLFLCGCIACAVLALARPKWGTRLVSDERIGFELVFAIDLSQSMLAEDTAPSRLEWSRAAALDLIDVFADAEIGLIGFRGTAKKLVPVTGDHFALQTAIRVVDAGYVSAPGSGIGRALIASRDSFTGREGKYRAVFLFTDGEDRIDGADSSALDAAKNLGSLGIPVIVIAVGTDDGSSIPTDGGVPLQDRNRVAVVTRRNLEKIARIAESSGGVVFRAEKGVPRTQDLERVFRRGEIEGEEGVRLEGRDRFGFILLMAVLCLTISVLVRAVRWRDVY